MIDKHQQQQQQQQQEQRLKDAPHDHTFFFVRNVKMIDINAPAKVSPTAENFCLPNFCPVFDLAYI
jgi:hypothetical protein